MATTSIPSPLDIFGPHSLRPVQVYEQAVQTVLDQCRDRMRRGVPATNVAGFLRAQYGRLAALGAGVEIIDDQARDQGQPSTSTPASSLRIPASPASDGAHVFQSTPTRHVVRAENVRYAPFGNAARKGQPRARIS